MRISTPPALLLALSTAACLLAQAPQTPAPQAAKPAPAQQATASNQQSPVTLHTQAKLVVVDVVVQDRDHHPVQNLKQQDFALLEANQPQVISSFEEHKGLTAGQAAKFEQIPQMPPGVFTNYVPTPLNSAVNILLLDALNTPLKDQQYVRQQLLNYLKNSRPGTNVAIFGLSTKLVMLQGFTSNPEILKSVVDKQASGKASVLLDDVVGGGGVADTADDINQDSMDGIMSASTVAAMQTFMDITTSFQLTLRAKYTLDAMNVLARYLASIPGRKNLIWFSGSFPLDILPDTDNGASDPFAAMADSEDEYRETTNLLARSQVAVYPIDARGLMTSPVFSAAQSGSKYARNPNAMGRDQTKFFNDTSNEHSTMSRMAEDTGGHAFYNTNGLTEAVDKAIDEGSNYYTLTYSPTNTKWKGDFRKIEVKLAEKGYTLEYRHGYYADDPNSKDSAVTVADAPNTTANAPGVNHDPALIFKAMSHGVPGASQILYKVRVIPTNTATEDTVAPENTLTDSGSDKAKGPFRRYSVDYAALAGDFSYTITPDGLRHAEVEFVTVVYQPEGVMVNHTSHVFRFSVTPEQFKRLQQGGFPCHQEISVPVKGTYYIRTGVHDLKTNRIGSTEVSVAAVKNLPPASTLAQPPAPAQPAPAQPAPAPPAPAQSKPPTLGPPSN